MAPKAAITLAIAFSAILTSAATIDKRIIQGEDAKDGEIKFIVSLRDENRTHQCGGSLLDGHTVLTAAHCVEDAELVSVTAGTVDVKTAGVEAKIASFKKHPDFMVPEVLYPQDPWYEHDIAIVKLSTPINESNTIEYASLPPTGSDAMVNSTAMAAGWGRQTPFSVANNPNLTHTAAKILGKVVLLIHAREDCAKYEGVGDRDTIICAGGEGENTCKGDSGGPLFDPKTGQLLGVTSLGTKINGEQCNRAPSLFTRIGSYIDFINKNLGSDSGSVPEYQPVDLQKPEKLHDKLSALFECVSRKVDPKDTDNTAREKAWKECVKQQRIQNL
ncbi:peptidase S1 domain protein [Metarhizium robertsii]|uniref:Chymotrypsin B1 n=2 Tax=Metarhizium robertsii TaxID=568076 RepID=E9EK34_METRA|nr:chymotrypsin B1 [Metarhizium robertsii ARSEF 23]EFZ03045.1 chymotrypsin B1 [Metarhizium robertsii ARSEF 23]EXU94462.1 peptidase S1 domain protein [Metarhizium robertsii]